MTVRRVDPSRIVQGRYEHPDANRQEPPPDHARDEDAEAGRKEDREKKHAAPPQLPPEDEATVPRLLANRPVLRWLRTGEDADAPSSSTFDRFLTDPEAEAAQCKIAEHLAKSPQSSLPAMLERADLVAHPNEPPAPERAEAPEDGAHDEVAARYNPPPEPPPPSFDAAG